MTLERQSDTLGYDDPCSAATFSFSAPSIGYYIYATATNDPHGLSDDDYAKAVVVDVRIDSAEAYIAYGGNDHADIVYSALPDDSALRSSISLLIKQGSTTMRTISLGPYLGEWQETTWDGKDDYGNPVAPGEYTATIKMVIAYGGPTFYSNSHTITVFDVEISHCDSSWLPKKLGDTGYKTGITASVVPSLASVSKDFKFTLSNVTAYPGYCVNRTYGTANDSAWDLRFETQTGWSISGSNDDIAQRLATTDSDASVLVSSFDYGAYGEITCEVTIDGQVYTAHTSGGTEVFVSIPRDDNHNEIGDKWPHDTGQDSRDDPDEDGLVVLYEYSGVDFDGDGLISDVERLNPNRRDLFVQGVGFGGNFPSFAWGSAFENADIDVHEFIGTIGEDDWWIDVLIVTLHNTGAHTTQVGIRDWRVDNMGEAYFGDANNYGAMCNVYYGALYGYVYDRPYTDGATMSAPGEWNDPPNSELDWVDDVEDIDDDGVLDPGEDQDGNHVLSGDHLLPSVWTSEFSVFDVDGNGYVETPWVYRASEIEQEYNLESVLLAIVTHEMGHAVGIQGILTNPPEDYGDCPEQSCVMRNVADEGGWDASSFCATCASKLRIHNR